MDPQQPQRPEDEPQTSTGSTGEGDTIAGADRPAQPRDQADLQGSAQPGWNEPPAQGTDWNQAPPQQQGWNQPPAQQQGGWNQPPAQQQGGWNQPQQQQGWNQPPAQQQGGWNQGAYYAPPSRPTGVTMAGIFYIVVGSLLGLGGLLLLLGGGMLGGAAGELGDFAGLGGMLGGMLFVGGIIFIVLAGLFLAAGIGALQGKGWARTLGIVLGVIFAVLGLLGLLGSLGAGMDAGSLIWNVLFTALYALAAWALYKAAPYFAAARR